MRQKITLLLRIATKNTHQLVSLLSSRTSSYTGWISSLFTTTMLRFSLDASGMRSTCNSGTRIWAERGPTSARTWHTLCICAMVKDVYLCRHCLFSLTRKLLLLHLMTPQFVGGVVWPIKSWSEGQYKHNYHGTLHKVTH